MKVSKLIEALSKLPQDLDVMLYDHEYAYHVGISHIFEATEELGSGGFGGKIIEID